MIALLPLLAVVTCAAFGGLALAIARAPGWGAMRPTAAALFAGAGYAATEAVTTGRWGEGVHLAAGQASLVFATLHGLAWLRVVGTAADARPRLDRAIELVSLLALLPALVPGLTHRAPILEHTLPALGVTYRDATPTALGLALFVGQLALLGWVVARFARDGRRGARGAALGLAVLIAAAVLDSASTLELLPLPYLTSTAYAAICLVVGVQATRQFSREAARLVALSEGLDARVQEQSAALAQARGEAARSERQRAVGELAAGVAQSTLPLLARSARLVRTLGPQDFRSPQAREAALARLEAARGALGAIARVGGDLLAASRIAASLTGPSTTGAAELLREALARVEQRLPAGTRIRLDADEGLRVAGAIELLVPALALAVARVGEALGARAGAPGLELRARRSAGRVELVVEARSAPSAGSVAAPVRLAAPVGGAPAALGWGGAIGLLRSQGGTVEEEREGAEGLRVRFSLAAA